MKCVEYSRSKIDKLSLYAAMGIPEFWRYNGTVLRIYQLKSGEYQESDSSLAFPGVSIKEIPKFIQESRKVGEVTSTRNFRNWVRLQLVQ
ncbi:MAG: hypothetical protein F6K47_10355 [Symploca sp. SIO2E6]|nr:hypothetical protein [Symploca sp. SIO2E6]